MATYRDVEMLQNSMQGLTDTLLRKRMMEQQEKDRKTAETQRREAVTYQQGRDAVQDQRAADQAKRQADRDAEEAKWRNRSADDAERRHQDAMTRQDRDAEARAQDKRDMQALQETFKKNSAAMSQVNQINSSVQEIRQGVASGVISPDDGNAQIKALHRQMKIANEALIGMTPLAVFNDNPDANIFQAKPGKPENPDMVDVTEKNDGTKEARYKLDKTEFGIQKAIGDLKRQADELTAQKKAGTLSTFGEKALQENIAKQLAITKAWETEKAKGAGQTATAAPATAAKPLDPETAKKFLQQAGGDKNKAREMARQAGFTF